MTIPTSAKRVVVLEQFAHLDWDWLNFFPYNVDESGQVCNSGYFVNSWVKPAATIYRMAGNLLQSFPGEAYSTCEIGFLRAFAEKFPDEFRQMVARGRVTIVGGAITSPDNLLPPGEAFFRVFLTGLNWMDQQALPWSGMVWIPDDFGHDSQLPVMLAAIGAEGVGFARVPGGSEYMGGLSPDQPQPMAGTILNQDANGVGGLDFWWKGDDGSTAFAHWMPFGYSQGSAISGTSSIDKYLSDNAPGSPSRYVHVPVGNDFMAPVGGTVPPKPPSNELLQWIDEWNGDHPDDYAITASFADYVHWVKQDVASGAVTLKTRTFHGDGGNADTTMFRSNPYFMGFYASRMELKRLHNEAVRLLVGAEVLDAASAAAGMSTVNDRVERFAAAWNDLAPSTHHDYITGTATDCVYKGEQLPLLRSVVEQAASLLEDAVAGIVTNLSPPSTGVAVLNTLGFERTGIVTLDNGGLVWGSAPALGWNIVSGATPPEISPVRLTQDPGSVSFDNGLFRCTIRKDANWGITQLSSNSWPDILGGGTGNTFSLWQDYGSIYSFGYECQNSSFSSQSFTQTAGDVVVQNAGPQRAIVSAPLTLTVGQTKYPYTLQYSVTAGQRYVEISITGAAPANTSVFVNFPLSAAITKIEHGTPYHWDWKTPATFGSGAFRQVFEPTHDFVVPYAGGRILAAILHGGVPAWAINGSTLTGCILRNTPGEGCDGRGAGGSDPDVHTITFALRVPDGLTPAATGLPLREARAYTNPLIGRTAAPGPGRSPLTFGLAAAQENALLTAAKRGSADPSNIYLRVYKPGNTVQTVVVSTPTSPTSISGATAVERSLTPDEEAAFGITYQPPRITFTAAHAVTTLKLSGITG